MPDYGRLYEGDLAPWFTQRCNAPSGHYSFDMAAGRVVVVCFLDALPVDARSAFYKELVAHKEIFDGQAASMFCVGQGGGVDVPPWSPGTCHIWDDDGAVAKAYGVLPDQGLAVPFCFVLDQRLRIANMFAFGADMWQQVLLAVGAILQQADLFAQAQVPVLMVPHIFEPEFCARLMAYYHREGGSVSAVFTEARAGTSAAVTDMAAKRRRDVRITDQALINQVQTRIFRRVVPEIQHAFQFKATRLERLIVACYDAEEKGHFAPHRDNTVAATLHRRFAVSINLNDDFEGGGVRFPEYSARVFKPPAGGALIFSCSMMHAVAPMQVGRRYACLPFVYDDAAAKLRRTAPSMLA